MNLCQCGCGLTAPTATRDRNGHKKGDILPFVRGHALRNLPKEKHGRWRGGRSNIGGYKGIKLPDHPRANAYGYVREHILIAERALGKPLPLKVKVHHVDHDRTNNSNANLVICEDQAYHQLLHVRERALRACGNANWLRCVHCGGYDDPKVLKILPRVGRVNSTRVYHNSCNTQAARDYRVRRR